MKKIFVAPKLEVIEFCASDFIMLSAGKEGKAMKSVDIDAMFMDDGFIE